MPTPFNHLLAAKDLLPALSDDLRPAMVHEWPAFLLGNIAPDVQTMSGQTREATHFFTVPLGGSPPAWQTLLTRHPMLASPHRLPPAHAAFIAGYLAHLEFDQLWVRDIFEPVFGPTPQWGNFAERIYLHNALRAYWDAIDLAQLPAEMGLALGAAAPREWLPFVRDADLARWRDDVAVQLTPGMVVRTVDVFAQRMGVDVEAFARLVTSPDEMSQRVLNRVSLEQLSVYRDKALAQSMQILEAYWAGALPV
ncbi:MAG: hypothetical protein ACT4QE_06560 [Anaerolineales bacterium]